MIFRIHRNDIHGNEGFHRAAAGNPGHLLACLPGSFGLDVVLGHDLFHLLYAFDLALIQFEIIALFNF